MKKSIFLFYCISAFSFAGPSAGAMTTLEYIQKYKADAIEQMLVYNIPASVTLAQGILESDCGNSELAVYANNHFGIKCHGDWSGPYFIYDDDSCGEHFRKYANVNDSYKDHARFLKSRPWYSFLFDYSRTDYIDWANGLSQAGYATAPDYAQHLIYIIEQNHLFDCDTVLQKLHGFGLLYGISPDTNNQNLAEYVIVKPGDCIYKIAREYNVDISVLCNNNSLSIGDVLVPGQKLYLREKRTAENGEPIDKKHSSDNAEDMSALPADTEHPEG